MLPLRIERTLLQRQGYKFEIEYVKNESNISDFISRYPIQNKRQIDENIYEKYLNFVTTTAVWKSLTINDISTATKHKKFLQNLCQRNENNDWNLLEKLNFDNETFNLLKRYSKFKDTLKINLDNDIILKDNPIILPEIFHKTSVKLAYIGHQGVPKTKALMRHKVFFLGIGNAIENKITNCVPCQATGWTNSLSVVQPTKIPEKVWDTVNIDYLGPSPNGKYVLAMIDQRSRYPVIAVTSSTSAISLIKILTQVFSQCGLPLKIISDNGPPFTSCELKSCFLKHSIQRQKIMPLWPQANGEMKRFMEPLTKVIRAAYIERKEWVTGLHEFVFAYRVTPHSFTNISPADLIIPSQKLLINLTILT